jgi:hypothetical protein
VSAFALAGGATDIGIFVDYRDNPKLTQELHPNVLI